MADVVRAAGGVVCRTVPDGAIEVLVVHRPRYDDWSLPKGKLDAGDRSELDCAVREVGEETGLLVDAGSEVGVVEYNDRNDRRKIVRYWTMTVRGGSFVANEEVDEVAWIGGQDLGRLSYEHDREIVRAVLAAFPRAADRP